MNNCSCTYNLLKKYFPETAIKHSPICEVKRKYGLASLSKRSDVENLSISEDGNNSSPGANLKGEQGL
jgi:hypothetical protein